MSIAGVQTGSLGLYRKQEACLAKQSGQGVVLPRTDPSLSQLQSLLQGDLVRDQNCETSLLWRQAPALVNTRLEPFILLPQHGIQGKGSVVEAPLFL